MTEAKHTRLVEIIWEMRDRDKCYCGHPKVGHVGWFDCALEEQGRRISEGDKE